MVYHITTYPHIPVSCSTVMLNALTIDVEDYFQVTAFERQIRRDEWDRFPLRVENNTKRILEMLDEFNIRATFFVLGWIAERVPSLVREIHAKGHEIACHGYGHELIYRIGPDNFRTDIRRAKNSLEDISGKKVTGYRAPSYSITKKSLWALDILIEEGFSYDSSIFPIYHDNYGIPDAPRFPYEIVRPSGTIMEFPLSTLQIKIIKKGFRLPIAGGGYLRLFPACLVSRGISIINKVENKPAVLYFHPWEIDPHQPRIKTSFKSRFRHYVNLNSSESKLRQLFSKIEFAPMAKVLTADKGLEEHDEILVQSR